tara:strand:- start:2255 stop:2458 length:204 start_codon:yes stop_codon:yes gene_type:complete
MNLSKFEALDPNLLIGLVNTALRNDHEDLEDLIRTHDIAKESLLLKLRDAGYDYVADINQFRAGSAG